MPVKAKMASVVLLFTSGCVVHGPVMLNQPPCCPQVISPCAPQVLPAPSPQVQLERPLSIEDFAPAPEIVSPQSDAAPAAPLRRYEASKWVRSKPL